MYGYKKSGSKKTNLKRVTAEKRRNPSLEKDAEEDPGVARGRVNGMQVPNPKRNFLGGFVIPT